MPHQDRTTAVGRPRVEVDNEQVTKLGELGCNDREIAGILGIGEATFRRLKNRDEDFVAALEKGRANLNVKLRRMQIEMALSGSVPMLIHLGKAVLGQGVPKSEEAKESPLAKFLPRAETIKTLPPSDDIKSD
jgi:hypothetical protein